MRQRNQYIVDQNARLSSYRGYDAGSALGLNRRHFGMRGMGASSAQDAFSAAALLNNLAADASGIVDPTVTAALQTAADSAVQAGAAIQNSQGTAGYTAPGVGSASHLSSLVPAVLAVGGLAYFLLRKRR